MSRPGVVEDESGAVVPGAPVTVYAASGAVLQQTTAGADGGFVVGPLPRGTYLVEASFPGFAPSQVACDLDWLAAPPVRVVVGVAPLRGEVTVTASRGVAGQVERVPAIVTVAGAEDLERRPLVTVGTALEGATGVMVQRSAQAQVSPFLRGLTGYQVVNLVDGVRLNNTTFRSGPNQYLAWITPAQVGRLEVMLGPASAQFGSDALGGVIQAVTPSLDLSQTVEWRGAGGLSAAGSTADRSTQLEAEVFLRGPRLAATAGVSQRRAGDVRAGGGEDSHHVFRRLFGLDSSQIRDLLGTRASDTGFSQWGGHAKATWRFGPSQGITAWYQHGEQQDVHGSKDLWGGLGRLQSAFDPQRLQLGYARYERLALGPLDWLNATVSVNAQADGSARQNLRWTDPIVVDQVEATAMGYTVQAGMHAGTRQALVFGAEVYDEHVDARRDETNPVTGVAVQKRALYPNGSRYTTTGAFVQDEVELVRGTNGRALVVRGGGRFTHVSVRTDADANRTATGASRGVVDSSSSYQDWTFNASLTGRVTPVLAVHGLVGRGFRAPNLNDLGALGLNDLGYEVPAEAALAAGATIGSGDGEGVLSTGTPVTSLSSERLMNYEVGLTLDWPRLYARAHVFDAELSNPIVRRTLVFPAAAPPTELAGIPVAPIPPTAAQAAQGVVSVAVPLDPRAVKAFVNDGRSRYRGIDSLARYRIASRWTAQANYSFLSGRDLDPARPVRRLPPQQASCSLRYQPGGVLSWVEADILASGRQDQLSGGDLTDERIGAARRRSDITDFFLGGRVAPYLSPGADGLGGTADDLFAPTGETAAMIRDRVLPIGATINGVTVVNDSTRVPLYTSTPGFVTVNVRAGLRFSRVVQLTVAVTNLLDRNYRVHGSGVDGAGRSLFATLRTSF